MAALEDKERSNEAILVDKKDLYYTSEVDDQTVNIPELPKEIYRLEDENAKKKRKQAIKSSLILLSAIAFMVLIIALLSSAKEPKKEPEIIYQPTVEDNCEAGEYLTDSGCVTCAEEFENCD